LRRIGFADHVDFRDVRRRWHRTETGEIQVPWEVADGWHDHTRRHRRTEDLRRPSPVWTFIADLALGRDKRRGEEQRHESADR
jgi:hypothetical protein